MTTSVKCTQCGLVNWSTDSSCKRCGTALNGSAPVARSRPLAATGYPQARLPEEAKPGQTIQPCLHCHQRLALSKWDSWNGFLVQCPNCGGLHGKRWNSRRVLLASFVFNAFSFLFTMRPAKAVIALMAFIVFAVAANFIDSEKIPDLLEIVGGSIFLLGPMLINAIVLVKHERDLDNSYQP